MAAEARNQHRDKMLSLEKRMISKNTRKLRKQNTWYYDPEKEPGHDEDSDPEACDEAIAACQAEILQEHTIDKKLESIPTIDDIDFKLREDIYSCENCRAILGHKDTSIFHKDPQIYTYIKKYRKVLRKDRVRPADLSDDPSSLKITKP